MNFYYKKNNVQKKKINLAGFTLFELLITISIMVVITTMFVINYRTNSNSFNRKQGVSEFIALANEAVSRVSGSYVSNLEGNYNGWGIAVIGETEYALFRCTYNNLSSSRICEFDENEIEIVKTLPEDLKFKKVVPGSITFGDKSSETSFSYWKISYSITDFSPGVFVSYGYVYTPESRSSADMSIDLLMPTFYRNKSGSTSYYQPAHANFFIEDTTQGTLYQVRMHRGGLVELLSEAEDTYTPGTPTD